jgi:[ribosomal protein S18]-alanine N-acetyltransferase
MMRIELTTDENILDDCALLMSESEPWLTLKRNLKSCQDAMRGDYKEVYIGTDHSQLVGFAVLQMAGTFKGYIQSILVRPSHRGRGFGSTLLKFCEERIFRISPNVFMCVSTFNTEAARLYYKLGYNKIGDLKDFIVRGHSETLLRKSIGTISEFNPNKL